MLPLPDRHRALPPIAPPPGRTKRAQQRLYVERRATRRQPTIRARGRRAPARLWLFAVAALPAAALGFVVGGAVGALTGALLVVLAAQCTAILWLRGRESYLNELAQTDELTALGNSRALWRDLGDLTTGEPVAVVMLDLDHFKQVNDRYGHPVGDALLRHAGRVLRVVAGDGGLCYRYGGEELVVLLPGGDEETAWSIAERLRAIIVRPPRGLPAVTASAGVAAGTPGAPAHQLIDRADRALRFAKSEGRDRTVRASVAEDWAADQDETVVAARRAALAMATAALDARDPATADHSDDVVVLCDALAGRLGISGREREHLLTAARLHDVGKVAVPHDILAKPAALDADEWIVMRKHTITGERILQSVPELAPLAPIVRHAHERFDGTGYPDGLAGEDIPLASRIILCADAFHAIRSDRPYRAARSVEEALQELTDNAGGQFDPSVAESLVSVVRDFRTPISTRPIGAALRRSPRLVALLMAVMVCGTAIAAERPLRKAFKAALPFSGRSVHAASRPAPAPATCATLNLQGTKCGHAVAAFGLLAASPAPAAPGAPIVAVTALSLVPDHGLPTGGTAYDDSAVLVGPPTPAVPTAIAPPSAPVAPPLPAPVVTFVFDVPSAGQPSGGSAAPAIQAPVSEQVIGDDETAVEPVEEETDDGSSAGPDSGIDETLGAVDPAPEVVPDDPVDVPADPELPAVVPDDVPADPGPPADPSETPFDPAITGGTEAPPEEDPADPGPSDGDPPGPPADVPVPPIVEAVPAAPAETANPAVAGP